MTVTTTRPLRRLAPPIVLALTTAVAVTLALAVPASADDDEHPLTAERIEGPDRFATAAAIAEARFDPDSVDEVYVASGRDFADALAAGPAAAAADAPILLTEPGSLPTATEDAITDLAPGRVTILGGTAAVTATVESALDGLVAEVERLAGETRYETAAEIAADAFDPGELGRVYLATGEGFADALAGGPAAALDGAPILLTTGDALPDATAEQLAAFAPDEVIVLGGSAVIDPIVTSEAAQAAGLDEVERRWGPDRYATAAEVAMSSFAPDSVDAAYVASGEGFADALAAVPAAAAEAAPLLLSSEEGGEPLGALGGLTVTDVRVLGGWAAVSDFAFDQLDGTLVPSTPRAPADVDLNAPAQAAAGEPFTMDVVVTDGDGRAVPGAGAMLADADAAIATPLRTDLDGVVRVERVLDLDVGGNYTVEVNGLEATATVEATTDVGHHAAGEDVEAVADCEVIGEESWDGIIAFPSAEGPGWDEAGPAPVLVDVVGCGAAFEGAIQYEFWHEDDLRPRIEGFTLGGGFEWARFEFAELLHRSGEWTVEIFMIDAADGSRADFDAQTFTVD